MSNPQTAEDWQRAADQIGEQRSILKAQVIEIEAAKDLAQSRFELLNERSNLALNQLRAAEAGGTPQELADARAAYQKSLNEKFTAGNNLNNLTAELGEARTQQSKLIDQQNLALDNAQTARSGPPNTNTNTPPASTEPPPQSVNVEQSSPTPVETPVISTVATSTNPTSSKEEWQRIAGNAQEQSAELKTRALELEAEKDLAQTRFDRADERSYQALNQLRTAEAGGTPQELADAREAYQKTLNEKFTAGNNLNNLNNQLSETRIQQSKISDLQTLALENVETDAAGPQNTITSPVSTQPDDTIPVPITRSINVEQFGPTPVAETDPTDTSSTEPIVPDRGEFNARTAKDFSATATATTAEAAEDLARSEARSRALENFGPNQTAFGSFDELKVKLNDNGTYTATYITKASETIIPAPVASTGDEALQATQDAEAAALANQEGSAFAPPIDVGSDAELRAIQAAQDAEAAALANQEGSAFAPPIETSGDEALQATQDAEAAALANQEGSAFAPPIETSGDAALQATQDAEAAALANQEGSAFAAPASSTPAATTVVTPQKEESVYVAAPDWRFRISLAPKSDYFYNAPKPGILLPLKRTNGVIFPYSPAVSVTYSARYETTKLTHSNYDFHNYQGSAVENITVAGDFTAQDVTEANYLLAVIHFFKSATKMFYGRDENKGIPPPLLYLSGFGQYQFDNHPVVLTGFTYSLPIDVDYINAYPNGVGVGVNGASLDAYQPQKVGGTTPPAGPIRSAINGALDRLMGSGLNAKGKKTTPSAAKGSPKAATANNELTRVPTKMNIQLTLLPVVTRKAASNQFSLEAYATGKLLQGSKNSGTGGGMW